MLFGRLLLDGAGCAAGIRRSGEVVARGGGTGRSGGAVQSRNALRNRPGRAAKLRRGDQVVSRIGGTRLSGGAIQSRSFLRGRPGRRTGFCGSGQMVSRRRGTGACRRAMQPRPVLPDRSRGGTEFRRRRKVVHQSCTAGKQNRATQSWSALRLGGSRGSRRHRSLQKHAALKSQPASSASFPSALPESIVSPARSQPSASDLVFPATTKAAPALSKTASRLGPRSSPRKIRRVISAF